MMGILSARQRYRLRTAEALWQAHGRAFGWHELVMWALKESSPGRVHSHGQAPAGVTIPAG